MANPILVDGTASPQSIYDEYIVTNSTNGNLTRQEGYHNVGTRAQLPDGRVFYYASNSSTALTAGSLCALVVTTGLNVAATDNAIPLTASFANFRAGATKMALHEADIETADIIENRYADGYMYFENTAGAGGHYYKVRGHDALNFDGTSTSKFVELYDPINLTAVATDEISFAKNPYDTVVTNSGSTTLAPIGVAPIAVTASTAKATDNATAAATGSTSFFWMQTWGPAAVECTTAVAPGVSVSVGGTADRVDAADANTHAATATVVGNEILQCGIGLVSAVAAAGDFGLVDLRIRP